MDKAILYLRYSPKPDAAECETLETQRDQCLAYCQLHKLDPAYVIEDPEVSGGAEFASRPGGSKALGLLEQSAASHLVVQRIDRLSRETLDGLLCLRDFRKAGVELHLSAQNGCAFCASTAMGYLILTVLLAIATFERMIDGERTRDKFAWMKRNGRKRGRNASFGFRLEGKLEVRDEYEQELLQRMRELRAAGYGYHAIANRFNEERVELPNRVRQRWDGGFVRTLLLNEANQAEADE